MNLTDEDVLKRYKRAKADSAAEHDRVLKETVEYYAAYGLDSIRGKDFADLSKVWGDKPPEVGMLLSNVNVLWGQLINARREPTFPGFDGSPGDSVIGEALTMMVKKAREWAGSDEVDAEALTDLLISGYAFGEDFLETEVRPPYRPKDRYIPVADLWWDTSGNEANLADAQEFIRRHRYSIDEAVARFPDHQDIIRALGRERGGGGAAGAGGEGARNVGGKNVTVSVTAADGSTGKKGGPQQSRRLREIPVDDFQFLTYETLASWAGPDGEQAEAKLEEFEQAMQRLEEEAAAAGEPFQRPPVVTYAQATWYRARVLAASPSGEPTVLSPAAPIPGNQPLIKAMTGYLERYVDGDLMKTRWFGFGRVLLGLQRLTSVAIRLEIEQEARRNRSSVTIEEDAFDNNAARDQYMAARAIPGSARVIPSGSWDKIHEDQYQPSPHVSSMQQLFQFFSVNLPAHMLGISDMSRGTFTEDRSAKFVSTMQESAITMQTMLSKSFTAWTKKGALTQLRLMLGPDGLDAADIDRLLGPQPPREGITAQKNPETGQLEPIPNPETGEPMTLGAFLKANVSTVYDNDINFGLRPSAASERMANAMLMMQHGFIEQLASLLPPGAGKILAPAALKGSFAEGSLFADVAGKLEVFLDEQEQQEQAQAQAQTEQGWVQFIQQLAGQDFEKAAALMQQASDAVSGPQGGVQ